MSDSNSNIRFVFKVASRARGRVGLLRPALVCLLTAVSQAKADEFKVSVTAAITGQYVGPRTQVAEDPVTESLSLQDGGHCEWGGFEGDWSAHASVSASAGAGGLSLQSHVKAVQPRACGGIDAMASSLSSMTIGDIVIMQTAGPPVGSVKGRLRLKAAGSAETRGWDTCGTGRGARVELNARIEINSLPLDGGAIYCRDGNAPEYSGVFAGENRELTLYVGSPLTIRIMVTHLCDAVGCGPNREVTNEALLTTNLALDPDIFELPPGFEVRSLKGACCLPPDETCRPRTEQRCASQQGRFLGVGTTCADAPCKKSCCLPDGSCAVLSEAECSARQGTYRPDDPSCENPCPGTTGACCLPAGGCQRLSAAECAARGGSYGGDGSTCETADRTYSDASGVSADGSVVVGWSMNLQGRDEAFRWSGGVITGLGFLDPNRHNKDSKAYGVSADGRVVVGWSVNGQGRAEAFRWSGGVMTGLGVLDPDYLESEAYAVSADGGVVVGWSWNSREAEAFRWSGGVMTGLGFLDPNYRYSRAHAVSADGSVVVGRASNYGQERYEAFRWSGGALTRLGSLDPNYPRSDALAVSANGSVVVGWSRNSHGQQEAVRWSGGVITGLGFLDPNYPDSCAFAVSADGNVVVGMSGEQAFIWDAELGMRSLKNELMSRYGRSGELVHWQLTQARAISADGRTIVGYGTNPAGKYEAWRVVLGRRRP